MIIEIILLIIFLIFFAFGFFLIYRQVALVKRGEFRNKDRFQCIIYGFIFSLAIMVVVAVGFIFAVKTPELWPNTPPNINPLVLLIPFMFSLAYMTVYPLIDFLFIALSKESDEGLTPFQRFISLKVINKFNKKLVAVLIALSFYLLVFILPPIILSIIGLPFIMIWISWMLVYPLMILTFYGSKGYIAGISNAYYHIPYISRSMFLNFEDPKRGFKQFFSEPGHYIILGLMLFVFVWAWISLFQTIGFFFTGSLAISTMSSVFVFVTLFFGIIGYFTRFWGRKIKYRGIDIYFAAYLMACIGINVLVNFLIVNPSKLFDTFNLWNITSQINANSEMFAWAAVIEEIVLIIFTSYFLLARKNEFIRNIKFSKITESGQSFDPIPLFNFIKNSDPKIRKNAEEALILMFERIPLKSDIDLNNWKFKNSLLDGLCDSDIDTRRISYQIFEQLSKDIPEVILPWIIESLESPNYEKNIPVLKILINTDKFFLENIPQDIIFSLLEEPEWRLKLYGLKLFSRLLKGKTDLIQKVNFRKFMNDPNSKIQIEILNILAESSTSLPYDIIIDKIFNANNEIRAAAIKNLKNLSKEGLDEKIVLKIIPAMKDPSSSVRASIFGIFANVGRFKKNKIPLLPLLEGLSDFDEEVRNAAILALMKYYEEIPNQLNLDEIINKIDPSNIETLNTILSLLGRLWKHNPEKVLTTLLEYIKFEDDQLKKNISNILVENYPINPDLIIQNLIGIPDDSGYLTKGTIAKTFIEIGRKDPLNLIKKLIDFLKSNNIDVKLNVINVIGGLVDDLPSSIDIKPILTIMQEDQNKQLKKEASKLISRIAKNDPNVVKPLISEFMKSISNQDSSVQIVLFRSLLEIASVSPELIPIDTIINHLSDSDSFIRETNTKILGLIGYRNPIRVVDVLINIALNDEEWIVREAGVSSLGNIVSVIEDKKQIIEKLSSLLSNEESWVLRSVLIILSKIQEVNEEYVPFGILVKSIRSNDPKVREASAKLLNIYSNQIDEIFDDIIILLGDNVEEVRTSTINSLVKIIQEVGINRILSKLLKNLSDEGTIEIQRSIALLFGRTAQYEDEKTRKRIVSLLKIRCEMSQDPIICNILQKLKEG
ncbi:MAG: HEAT repeat domain-containing protein [Candidatus Lokiarchaeota archaeon]|nr:HEAT repeat domain-containing protein [Candidatus Lokiarchaeota archaeon]